MKWTTDATALCPTGGCEQCHSVLRRERVGEPSTQQGEAPLEDLTRPLINLGMKDAFLSGRADFSGMDGTRDLFVSGVFHKAFIEVNEEGSEAAAATAVAMKKGPAASPVFRADHPFLFLIRENGTGSILFLGRLSDPG